jgi:hypothetical protein
MFEIISAEQMNEFCRGKIENYFNNHPEYDDCKPSISGLSQLFHSLISFSSFFIIMSVHYHTYDDV